MIAPVLTTARLRLRPVTTDDVDTLHALWIDPQVRRWLWDDQVISRPLAAEVTAEAVAAFAAHGYGFWLALDAQTDAVVGFCGLRAAADPSDVELLYGLAPAWWGQGYAGEAATAVLRHGFDRCGLARIVAQTDAPNAASIRLLERLGMTHVRQVRKGDAELVDFALRAEDLRHDRAPGS